MAHFREYYNYNLHNLYIEISIAIQSIRCDLMYKSLEYALKNFADMDADADEDNINLSS